MKFAPTYLPVSRPKPKQDAFVVEFRQESSNMLDTFFIES